MTVTAQPTRAFRLAGIAAVLGAAVLWGSTGTVQALLPEAREPLVVAALRLLIGAATLAVFAALAGQGVATLRRLPAGAVVVAGLAIGAYNLLFFAAVLRTGVGIGTALAIGSAPVWVTLFEVTTRRRLPEGRRLAGQAVCIAGAALLVVSGVSGAASPAGMAMALAAGAAYAGYSLLTSRIGHLAPSATVAAATFAVAALAAAPALVLLPVGWAAAPASWPGLLFLGTVATGVSYALYTWGLRHVAASTAVTLALAEPLTAWVLATLVVGEPVTAAKLAGAVLLLAGLAIVTGTRGPDAAEGSRRG